jgi:dipeptidyl aminopeptidase/acylaminoacyl peptidase
LLAYRHIGDKRFSEGIRDLTRATSREFAFTPDNRDTFDARWTTHGELFFNVLPAGDSPFLFDMRSGRLDKLAGKWRESREGRVSTASEVGSGNFAKLLDSGVTLAVANGATGGSRTLGTGRYEYSFASPDGQTLAGLRNDRLDSDPNQPIEFGANIGAEKHSLVVYDLAGKKGPIEPCKNCDVLLSSLNWSPDGRYLAFAGRDAGATWDKPSFWVFDRNSGVANKVVLPGRRPHVGRVQIWFEIRSAWIGGRLALLLDHDDGKPALDRRDIRADWWLLGRGAPTNITSTLPGDTPELIATTADSAVVMSGDRPWRLTANGTAIPLAPDVKGPLADWQRPGHYSRSGRFDIQPSRTLVLQTKRTAAGKGTSVSFVDLETGKVDTVVAPSGDAVVADASVASHRVAFVTTTDNVTTLAVRGPNQAEHQVVEINGFLRDVVGGTPIRIDHKGPEGDERHSWMLLPPGHVAGRPVPTIVNVYPGRSCPETYRFMQLNTVHALNDHILAARGYAVLYPCVKADEETYPRDPMGNLVPEVFSGVDAAIAQGYADPDRLAVQGQSMGGYTTGALVGLTGRFKSAVAQAGLYDMISLYGVFDVRQRMEVPYKGIDLFGVGLAGRTEFGLGSAPWQDTDRFVRNSPLMHVGNVTTPILLMTGDLDYVSTTQSEEFFTALTHLNKDARFVRYFGEDHVLTSPANIRDQWKRIIDWYGETLGPPAPVIIN